MSYFSSFGAPTYGANSLTNPAGAGYNYGIGSVTNPALYSPFSNAGAPAGTYTQPAPYSTPAYEPTSFAAFGGVPAANQLFTAQTGSASNPLFNGPVLSASNPIFNAQTITASPRFDGPTLSASNPLFNGPALSASNPLFNGPVLSASNPLFNGPVLSASNPLFNGPALSASNPLFNGPALSASNPLFNGPALSASNPLFNGPALSASNPLFNGPALSASNPLFNPQTLSASNPLFDSQRPSASNPHFASLVAASQATHTTPSIPAWSQPAYGLPMKPSSTVSGAYSQTRLANQLAAGQRVPSSVPIVHKGIPSIENAEPYNRLSNVSMPAGRYTELTKPIRRSEFSGIQEYLVHHTKNVNQHDAERLARGIYYAK